MPPPQFTSSSPPSLAGVQGLEELHHRGPFSHWAAEPTQKQGAIALSLCPSSTLAVKVPSSEISLTYPPGVGADEEALGGQFMRAAPENLAEAVGEFMGALEHYHPHDEDCWYLPLIGIDPAHQGKGLGAALMKHATDLIDSQGALSYLESSTPQNISLYERHGFESTGQILFGEANNIATPMVRDRR